MIDFELQVEEADFLAELAGLEMEIARKLLMTMDQVGWEVVGHLRSLTDDMRPPARPGEPYRRAHPGGWADVTGNLANAYTFELYSGDELVRWVAVSSKVGGGAEDPQLMGSYPAEPRFPLELRFLNGMEYAAALEARDGYWVIREITEAGGPVRRALRTVLAAVAPDAEIVEG